MTAAVLAEPVAPRTDPPPTRRRTGPALVLAFAAAVTLVWTVTAARAADRGFDLTDEGFYLLSYRWWNADHRTFSGVRYLYGPVFALLGHDVAGLRLVRLGTVLAAHLIFGWAFMRWLRPRRPAAPPTRLWEAAGAACVMAAGGTMFSWLPHTPGYNDVVLLGALLTLAAVLSMDRPSFRPGWPIMLGVVAVAMVLTKWSTVLWLIVLLLVGAVGLTRGRARAAGWITLGAALAVGALHLLVVPLTVAVPEILTVNRLLSERSFAIPDLLHRYATSTRPTLVSTGRDYGLLLTAGVVAVLARRPIPQAAAGVLGLAGLTWATVVTVRDGGLGGGPPNAMRFIVPMLAALAMAALVGTAARIDRGRAWLLLGAVAAMPVVTAFGTSNAPLKMAAPAFGAWVAVLIAVLTGIDRGAVLARGLVGAVVAGSLLVTVCVATGGIWRNPYREQPYDGATVASGVPALSGLELRPSQARDYRDLHAALAPYLTPGRRIVGLDKMAGVVFLLDGRTLGEGWYAPEDPARTRAGIAAACADGAPDQEPIVILNRPVRAADATVLASCGLDLRRDYRPLSDRPGGLTVLVPA